MGSVLRRLKISTDATAMIDAVSKFPEPRVVVVEESSQAQWAADVLRPYAKVAVVDARHNRLISEATTKSDPLDAHRLAELYRLGGVREVYHSSDAQRVEFKRSVQQYEDLTYQIVDTKNRIRAVFRQYGISNLSKEIYHPKKRTVWLERLPEAGRMRLMRWYEVMDKLMEVRQETLTGIAAASKSMEEIRLLRGIPGLGPVTAFEFVAYVQTPERFRRPNQLWSYSRLAVVDRNSAGKPLGRQHLSNQGVGILKAASRRVFQTALRKNKGLNPIAAYYMRCRQRGMDAVHARLTTQRKILTTAWAIWKKKEAFDPKKLLISERV
jgi:transposase